MSTTTVHTLKHIALFSTIDDEAHQELLTIMSERVFKPGEVIMTEGEQGASFHVIQEGEVEIWLTDSDGQKVVLDILGPGNFFGELSMLSGAERSASATSQNNLVTLELDRTEFFDFLKRRPEASFHVLTKLAERLKHTDEILRTRVSRNPNAAADERLSLGQRIADVIAEFSGSIAFLVLNAVIFAIWIVLNTVGPAVLHFDPYPYQFLTMSVSLEAIFLSIFVLVSQNRQSAKDRLKADLDYQVDVKAEVEMETMGQQLRDLQEHLHHMHQDILELRAERKKTATPESSAESSTTGTK